jgi:glycosyltransferase involved in cell wall biosynthesis
MRLLFCCELYHPSRGGVQEVMRQIAERLAVAGHDVTVATRHLAERKSTSHNGVNICGFQVAGNAIVGMRGEVDRYRDFVLDFDADAILIKAAQQWTFDALWPVLDQIKARKVFIPCGFSGLYEKAYAAYFAQLPDVLRKFDHLVFYAEKYRDIDFAREHGLTNYSKLPNGASELEFEVPAEPAFRARLGIFDDAFVVLTVGSPINGKGHRQVAEAFSRLESGGRPVTLVLNGEWPALPASAEMLPGPARTQGATGHLGPAFQKVIRGLARAGRIATIIWREGWAGSKMRARLNFERWRTGPGIDTWIEQANAQAGKRVLCTDLPRADLVQAFMAADLFVFASTVEYSPLVLFETAAAGTPFLSIPVGNAEEIARWTGAGMICPAAKDRRGYVRVDPSLLAREIGRCMESPDLLVRIGAIGKERWRRMFTWRAIAPQYEAILSGRASGVMPQEFLSGETPAAAGHESVQRIVCSH